MADNFDLESADNVADEADLMHRPARRHQRRGYCQEGIARADRVDYIFGKSGDCMNPSRAQGHTSVLALRHDDL